MLEADDATAAAEQGGARSEDRVEHWWDGSKEMSRLFAETLGLQGPAWDVYLLYPPGVRWKDDLPPAPTFWMHQLPSSVGADPELHLRHDPERLGRVLDELLARNTEKETT